MISKYHVSSVFVILLVSLACCAISNQHFNNDFEFIENEKKTTNDVRSFNKPNSYNVFANEDELENEEFLEQISRCKPCGIINETVKICGSDGKSYDSECQLNLTNCLNNSKISILCENECPCKSKKSTKSSQNRMYLMKKYRYFADKAGSKKFNEKSKKSPKLWLSKKANEANEVYVERKHISEQCKTLDSMKSMGTRLLEWFTVLMNDPVNSVRQKHLKINRSFPKSCKNEVKWMYNYLDVNSDGLLAPTELIDLENYPYETCLKPFLLSCDFNEDVRISIHEWCRCFSSFDRKFLKQNVDNFEDFDTIDDDDDDDDDSDSDSGNDDDNEDDNENDKGDNGSGSDAMTIVFN